MYRLRSCRSEDVSWSSSRCFRLRGRIRSLDGLDGKSTEWMGYELSINLEGLAHFLACSDFSLGWCIGTASLMTDHRLAHLVDRDRSLAKIDFLLVGKQDVGLGF